MDVLTLSPIRFAANISFHIIFPMITIYTVFLYRVFGARRGS